MQWIPLILSMPGWFDLFATGLGNGVSYTLLHTLIDTRFLYTNLQQGYLI